MPRTPAPLPEALDGLVFTAADARRHGVGPGRLRRADLRPITRGAHRRVSDVPGSWHALGLPRPVAALAPEEAAVVVGLTGGVASHVTAARLHGLVLPPWTDGDDRLHVSRPHARGATIRPGVVNHGRRVPEEDVTELWGIRVTSLERTWADLCSLLRPEAAGDAVVAGDALVRHPWTPQGRVAPRTTLARLRAAVVRAGRFQGVRIARAALERIRVGADSPPETRLRLALVDAGLPEPRLQARLAGVHGGQADADLFLERARVALHYDGAHHRTAAQQARDARRDRIWQEAGALSLTVTREDLAEGFVSTVETVLRRDRALRAALSTPPSPLSFEDTPLSGLTSEL